MDIQPVSSPPTLELLYEDEHYVAINKPAGMLVHRTSIAKEEQTFIALQLLRDQIGCKVYPLHRIDRPTSGIVMFAKQAEAASLLQPLFPTQAVKKFYLAIVRGYMHEENGVIDSPLRKKLVGELQEARTEYWSLAKTEIPFASSNRYDSSRYSLIKVYPHTGRMHQIRRHMAHDRHYVIGDNTHGDGKQNNFFRKRFDSWQLMLHAWQLEFSHPYTASAIHITAPIPEHFQQLMNQIKLSL
jgi:tRNA pseudouridine65 synthase